MEPKDVVSVIGNEFAELSNQISILDKNITELENRIAPLRNPCAATPSSPVSPDDMKRPAHSPIAEELHRVSERIQQLSGLLRQIVISLEI